MSQEDKSTGKLAKRKVFKPSHEEPKGFAKDYILLPYGVFYKTAEFLSAKPGDILRFFNGGEFPIYGVALIEGERECELLCRVRYGIKWQAAFERWLSYARMEGHSKSILSPDKCIMIVFDRDV